MLAARVGFGLRLKPLKPRGVTIVNLWGSFSYKIDHSNSPLETRRRGCKNVVKARGVSQPSYAVLVLYVRAIPNFLTINTDLANLTHTGGSGTHLE